MVLFKLTLWDAWKVFWLASLAPICSYSSLTSSWYFYLKIVGTHINRRNLLILYISLCTYYFAWFPLYGLRRAVERRKKEKFQNKLKVMDQAEFEPTISRTVNLCLSPVGHTSWWSAFKSYIESFYVNSLYEIEYNEICTGTILCPTKSAFLFPI